MTDQVKYLGVVVEIGEKKYIIPALSLKAIKELGPKLDKAQAQITAAGTAPTLTMAQDMQDAIVDVVFTALKRNYPSISKDQLEEDLDLANLQDVMPAIMGESGLMRVKEIPGDVPSGGSSGPVDWDMIYWDLIAATGWTWEYIDDEMTLPRLLALTRAWKTSPPVHRLIANYMGFKREAPLSEEEKKKRNWEKLRGLQGKEGQVLKEVRPAKA